jgi:predicted GNAT family N-acyltransferase
VRKAFRKQKVGTKLIQLALDRLLKYKVKNIGLTAESSVSWLPIFYKKIGFESPDDIVYLEYNTLKRGLKV